MMLFPVVGIFIMLMAATVIVCVAVALGVILFSSGRRGGPSSRVPGPGEMDVMTDSMHAAAMAGHAPPGISEADRLIATGIAVDALTASQAGGHAHHAGHHDAGMHQDVSPPMHHDPGPTTMPSHVDSPPSHHG